MEGASMLSRRIPGIASALLGVLLLLVAIPANVTDTGTIIMNPALFPKVAAWLLIGLGLLQVAAAGPAPEMPEPAEMGRFALVATLTVAATVALRPLGFPVTSVLFMAAVALMVHERRPVWLLTTVVGIPLGVWLFFDRLLERPLP
jgi:hypothetical protein